MACNDERAIMGSEIQILGSGAKFGQPSLIDNLISNIAAGLLWGGEDKAGLLNSGGGGKPLPLPTTIIGYGAALRVF